MKRSVYITLSFLVLLAGSTAFLLNCSWALDHHHEHGHHSGAGHTVSAPSAGALAEIHCSKIPHVFGPMLRSAATEGSRPPVRQVGPAVWPALPPDSHSVHLESLLLRSKPPNLPSRGVSYRHFLSVLQI